MSFGFAIGDFIAVGQLAWTLYRECYQIARGAPQEFSLLVNELSTLSNSLTILQEEVKDPESTLRRAGDDRVRMVNEMIAGIEETLKRLRKVACKYDVLGSGSKTKRVWVKFKWSAEFSSIDRLRNKLVYHNTVMSLLLTSVGNSSLQRIESSNAALASDFQAIKDYIASNQAVVGSKVPALSAIDDDPMSSTLSASLMIYAEASQPWSTIGFDQWVGAGEWWLLRAQLELRTIREPEHSVAPAAYANLIKAAWILADLIPCHPQFPFISATKSSQLRLLSAEVKNEFSRIATSVTVVPTLDELRSQELRIWECLPVKAPILRSYKGSQDLDAWRVDGGEHVLFRGFAFYTSDSATTSPCILLFLVHESAKAARLVAQDQYGDILKAILLPKSEVPPYTDIHLNYREDGDSVVFGKGKFVLNHVQEARVLWNMVEATIFYMTERRVDDSSLEDLKAYMLLTAVKNREKQAAVQIRQEICKMDNIVESDQKGSLAQLAVSMTSQWIKGRLFEDDSSDWRYPRCWTPKCSLFSWAVVCKHTTLTEFLLSEDPVSYGSVQTFPDETLLELSAQYGNEPVVRWSLKHVNGGDRCLTDALYHAIGEGHANVVALLLNAGARLYGSPRRRALLSTLSELVVHAILAMAYTRERGATSCLLEAADRGHEGAVVLLSYANTMERLRYSDYQTRSTHSGHFEQLVAVLARGSNIIPAFDLTLMAVERQKTEVLLKVLGSPLGQDIRVYLDSYHAYVENVSEGLSETYKKVVKIGMSGDLSFTVVHQEESLRFCVYNQLEHRPEEHEFYYHDHDAKSSKFGTWEDRRAEIPIHCLEILPDDILRRRFKINAVLPGRW